MTLRFPPSHADILVPTDADRRALNGFSSGQHGITPQLCFLRFNGRRRKLGIRLPLTLASCAPFFDAQEQRSWFPSKILDNPLSPLRTP